MARPVPISLLLGLCGCWTPPDLPLVDEVPIVANDRCAASREATVACVVDGDTFDIGACGEGGERVRLVGLDAPDLGDPPECWAENAAAELARRIEGRRILLTFDGTCADGAGTTLAWAWVDVGTEEVDEVDITLVASVNEGLIVDGHAALFQEEFAPVIYQPQLEQAQALAQTLGRGLWGACATGA